MINVAFFTALILVFLRLIAFYTVTPVFFPKGTPVLLKVGFTLILAYIIIPGIGYNSVVNINNIAPFIQACVSEVTTGLTLGFITELCFMSAKFAGNLMDLQVGFSMMSMFDPNSNSNATLLERLLYWVSLILFFIVDGHHMLILQLINSFKVVNIGRFILGQDTAGMVVTAFIEFFSIGLKIAIPIVLIIIITDLTLGLVARTVPQLNVMILGLPIKILVGLSSFLFALPIFINIIAHAFSELPEAFKGIYKTIPFIIIFASEDKTEEATPHKLSEAKKKGQVAKSKEVNLALTLLASTLMLSSFGSYAVNILKDTMEAFLNSFLNMELTYENVFNLALIVIWRLAMVILPMVFPIMIMGVFANFIQTGIIFTKEPLKPDLKKLNPINGFKKMFSARTVVELIKDISLVSIVGYVGFKFLKDNYSAIINLNNLRFHILLEAFGKFAFSIFFKITLIMVVIALADFIFQKRQFKKDMKMTKQEIKEEFKQMEGDPQIKGKIKQKQREMAMKRMMQSVPDATVVITNPTHFAVALRYKDGIDSAPRLVAKGADYVAIKIKEKAKDSDVPIVENKPLARLIYNEVELDSEIPVEMYQAVAEILAVVMKLK
ncbi:flagellar biosynthetic protein FliR/FlhB [Clostridium tetanomorphum]|uniref:Flagellar biosynthetic protein FliR n=1 Tax=Clostridium tetanomorphum TaxID=1553 RepID=A0A923J0F2_CLOTT|nr:fused FliR family export protein/FlhB family type III secretion system protein [Clostridium tetanomorphum]KAJ49925.1 bifunctional flagellar biosynthesis protein FliR/FlhB [Clostridium tetanomorphum DSM 665]MBC2396670.1 fused FliR family export protein/FlhB family type III secretion system protein [Clostridium tetanomorphum]MBP1866137.1 flagellar biosynthetic protein FliR/FlhB [Clostridium tetanomorphum]NRS85116.1 flagellar biosynthetic protein FliR/FlhB [Clostridium tetanomorphum]NRZ98297.1